MPVRGPLGGTGKPLRAGKHKGVGEGSGLQTEKRGRKLSLQGLNCTGYCAKLFADVNSLNSCNQPLKQELFSPCEK